MKCALILTFSFAIFNSCNTDDFRLSPRELQLRATSGAVDNTLIITNAEEILDITAEIINDEGMATGLTSGGRPNSGRACNPLIDRSYLVDRTHYDTTLYVGTMTIDYSDGKTCSNSVGLRKGKVIDNFIYILNYKTNVFTIKETITFENYINDSVTIDGSMVILSKADEPVTLETEKIKMTYQDGSFVTWKGLLRFVSRNINLQTEDFNTKNISGTIEGITRRKESFTATITQPLEYNYQCDDKHSPVPVKGTLNLNIINEFSSVEYGDGICDYTYIVNVAGNEFPHSF